MMQQSTYMGLFLPQQFSDQDGACQEGRICFSLAPRTYANVVPARAGYKIWVPSIAITANAAARGSVELQSNTTGQIIIYTSNPTASNESPTIILPFNPAGWFNSVAGQSLGLVVGGANCVISFPYFYYKISTT